MQKIFMQGRVMAADINKAYLHIADKLAGHEILGMRIFAAPVQCSSDIWWEWMAEVKEAK